MEVLQERKRALAKDALRYVRGRLKEKLPAFRAAFEIPKVVWTDQGSGTDGETIYWKEDEVFALFSGRSEVLERQYLHLLLHGLYLHPLRDYSCTERIWHLACDLMTEYRIDRMHVEGFTWPIPEERSRCYRQIRESKIRFHERELSGWLSSLAPERMEKLEEIFRRDNHRFWEAKEEKSRKIHEECAYREEKARRLTEAVHRWRTVFEQMELREEEHRRQAGGSRGTVREQIVLQKERAYDYRQFLKQFAVSQEELSLDMDSFDYIPYDYSRRMYENLVFLEPLEYKEMRRLLEFVIAIDTSGSCSGAVVRRFLTETWEILEEKENFFRNMRIHLIQCDCAVQEHVCVTCEEEWKAYLEKMEVKGHGDTDFTPVFRLVDQMKREGELSDLKGLLYFTDGDGIYPEHKPDYEIAFVFLNEELMRGKAPAWAQTLTLDIEMEWETGR